MTSRVFRAIAPPMMIRIVVIWCAAIIVVIGHASVRAAVRGVVVSALKVCRGHHSWSDQSTISADTSEAVTLSSNAAVTELKAKEHCVCVSVPEARKRCLKAALRLLAALCGTVSVYVKGRTRGNAQSSERTASYAALVARMSKQKRLDRNIKGSAVSVQIISCMIHAFSSDDRVAGSIRLPRLTGR